MNWIPGEKRPSRRLRLAVVGIAALAAVIFAGAAWAHPYTASISPSAAGTGDSDIYAYKITNNYSPQKPTKLEVTIPTGWSVTNLGAATATDGSGWNAPTVSSGKIVVSATGSGLGYTKSLSFTFTGKATCTAGTSTWTPKVTNGSTVWSLTPPTPTVAVTKPGRLASFSWTQSPAITQTAGVEFGGVVKALDSCGNVKSNYTGATATATSNMGTSPSGQGPSFTVSWLSGVGTAKATDYNAKASNGTGEVGRSLTVADSAAPSVAAASSGQFEVVPGQLGSFTLANIGQQVAGVLFGVTATAYDKWLNQAWNYSGGATTGPSAPGTQLNTAPDLVTTPIYGSFGAWVNGTSTANVTAFRAETGRTVTVSDGAASATSNLFDVVPGQLGSFSLASIPDQIAGPPGFGVTATAFDKWLNLAWNYPGGATVGPSGAATMLDPSPNPKTDPLYGAFGAWSGGSSTAQVTAFDKETGRAVTVTDATDVTNVVSEDSNPFAVKEGPLSLSFSPFSLQPGAAQWKSLVYADPVTSTFLTVSAVDAWGNVPDTGTNISIALAGNPHPAGGAFTAGSTPSGLTDANGVATLSNLNVDTVADGYALQATLGPAHATSGTFNVVYSVSVCSGSSCNGSASNPNGQTTSTSLAAAAPLGPAILTTSFLTDPLAAPAAAGCGASTLGTGFDVQVQGGSPNAAKPTLTVTLTVPPNLLIPGKQAWQYDVCLGVKPYDGAPATPWKSKKLANLFTRKDAVSDGNGFQWAVVPACVWNVFEPGWLSIPSTNPCIVSKTISQSTGLSIVLKKPWPWDGKGITFG